MRDEKLIELVKAHTFIYNKRDVEYRNKQKKEATWREIASILKSNPRDCIVRWTSIRDRYTREVRTRKLGLPTGPGASTKRPWHLFNHLSFLDAFIKHRQTSSSFTDSDDHNHSLSCEEEVFLIEPTVDDVMEDDEVSVEESKFSVGNLEIPQDLDYSNRSFQVPTDIVIKKEDVVIDLTYSSSDSRAGYKIDKLKKQKDVQNEIHSQVESNNKTSSYGSNMMDQFDPDYLLGMSVYASLKRVKPDRAMKYRKRIRLLLNEMEDGSS